MDRERALELVCALQHGALKVDHSLGMSVLAPSVVCKGPHVGVQGAPPALPARIHLALLQLGLGGEGMVVEVRVVVAWPQKAGKEMVAASARWRRGGDEMIERRIIIAACLLPKHRFPNGRHVNERIPAPK